MCDRKRSLILTGHLDNRDLDSYVTSQARGWFRRAVTHTHTHRGWRPLQQALISGAFKGREETGSVQSWSWPAAHISQTDSCFCLTAPRTCALLPARHHRPACPFRAPLSIRRPSPLTPCLSNSCYCAESRTSGASLL